MSVEAAGTAVLLVHGIGEQVRGATLAKFLRGLNSTLAVAPTIVTVDEVSARVTIDGHGFDVREVWWADLLSGGTAKGSFKPLDVHALAWFPWLNLRFKVYTGRPIVRSLVWTLVLGPVAILLQFTLRLWLAIITGVMALRRRVTRIFGVAPMKPLPVSYVLDSVVADVTNYVASAASATRAGSPLAGAAALIQQRFIDAVRAANPDGRKSLVVVAHSLGTVIAYHALAGNLGGQPAAGVPILPAAEAGRVTHLITIGSPLEKIRWIWPMLTGSSTGLSARIPGLVWTNMRDRLDLVAGKLRHCDTWGAVGDIALIGRAGVTSAHTAYELNPDFTLLLTTQLGIPEPQIIKIGVVTRLRLFAASLGVSALVIAAIPLVVGLAVILGGIVLIVYSAFVVLSSGPDNAALNADVAATVAHWGFIVQLWLYPIGFGVILPLVYGRAVAGYQHYAFRHGQWPAPTKDDPGESANEPQRRWYDFDTGVRRILKWTTLLLLLAASVPLGHYTLTGLGFTGPLDAGLSTSERVGYSIEAAFEGLLAEAFLGCFVFAAGWVVLRALPSTVRAYRGWVRETTMSPKGPRLDVDT